MHKPRGTMLRGQRIPAFLVPLIGLALSVGCSAEPALLSSSITGETGIDKGELIDSFEVEVPAGGEVVLPIDPVDRRTSIYAIPSLPLPDLDRCLLGDTEAKGCWDPCDGNDNDACLQISASSALYARDSVAGPLAKLILPVDDYAQVTYGVTLRNQGPRAVTATVELYDPPPLTQGIEGFFNHPDCDGQCAEDRLIRDMEDPSNGTREAVIDAILGARHSVDFAIFGFDDKPLQQALCNAGRAEGVSLRMVTDWRSLEGDNVRGYFDAVALLALCIRPETDGFVNGILATPKNDRDLSADEIDRLEVFFAERNVQFVRGTNKPDNGGIMHHKFFLVDAGTEGELLITGSMNQTTEGMTINHNHMLFIRGAAELNEAYRLEFEKLFDHCRHDPRDGSPLYSSYRPDGSPKGNLCEQCTGICAQANTSSEGPFTVEDPIYGTVELGAYFSPSAATTFPTSGDDWACQVLEGSHVRCSANISYVPSSVTAGWICRGDGGNVVCNNSGATDDVLLALRGPSATREQSYTNYGSSECIVDERGPFGARTETTYGCYTTETLSDRVCVAGRPGPSGLGGSFDSTCFFVHEYADEGGGNSSYCVTYDGAEDSFRTQCKRSAAEAQAKVESEAEKWAEHQLLDYVRDIADPACMGPDANCLCHYTKAGYYTCEYCGGPEGNDWGIMGAASSRLYTSIFAGTDMCYGLALGRAAARGVRTIAIFDRANSFAEWSRDDFMCGMGVEMYHDDWNGQFATTFNHTKMVVADDVVYDGSMNISASGSDKNNENTILYRGAAISNLFAEYIEAEAALLARRAPARLLNKVCFGIPDSDYKCGLKSSSSRRATCQAQCEHLATVGGSADIASCTTACADNQESCRSYFIPDAWRADCEAIAPLEATQRYACIDSCAGMHAGESQSIQDACSDSCLNDIMRAALDQDGSLADNPLVAAVTAYSERERGTMGSDHWMLRYDAPVSHRECQCNDRVDNVGDGIVDDGYAACGENYCYDGDDNDGDGLIDLLDDDCLNQTVGEVASY